MNRQPEKVHFSHYLIQPILAGVYLLFVLFALEFLAHPYVFRAIGYSTLGSSAFIVFASPKSSTADARHVMGGYLISILVGLFFWWFVKQFDASGSHFFQHVVVESSASVCLVVTMLFMFTAKVAHPPAVGLAVGLLVEEWDLSMLLIVIFSVLLLIIMQRLLRPYLRQLI